MLEWEWLDLNLQDRTDVMKLVTQEWNHGSNDGDEASDFSICAQQNMTETKLYPDFWELNK